MKEIKLKQMNQILFVLLVLVMSCKQQLTTKIDRLTITAIPKNQTEVGVLNPEEPIEKQLKERSAVQHAR